MRLVPGDTISDSIAFTGIYDLPLTRMVLGLARDGGRLVDVGANLGYFSLIWSAAKKGNSATAFEAAPRNLEILWHNVGVNRLEHAIDVHSQAVGMNHGVMDFDPGPQDQTGWGGLQLNPAEHTHKVEVVRLDEVLGDEQIDLLKIDIEGADTWALQGAERLLRNRQIRYVLWEQNQQRMQALNIPEERAIEFLMSVGYQPMVHGNCRGDVTSWYATPH
jgi:FkbM family methyltransferase